MIHVITKGSILEVKCCPMYKDQGVGMVVNNQLYLSLGWISHGLPRLYAFHNKTKTAAGETIK